MTQSQAVLTAGKPPSDELLSAIAQSDEPQRLAKDFLAQVDDYLNGIFLDNMLGDICELVNGRATYVDALLRTLWNRYGFANELSLIAIGGYGRGELHPHSDIDLLLLTPEGLSDQHTELGEFVTLLWDLGLKIGHSVRSVSQNAAAAAKDITVMTTLVEARLLAGPEQLYNDMLQSVSTSKMWPSDEFFIAKTSEQQERHRKFAHTEYNLEPNLKSSPGGLRDMQTMVWVGKRHFSNDGLEDLVELGFISTEELDLLRQARDHLWRIRYALHLLVGRAEDRLGFDHQRSLATQFGYEDDENRLAVEGFMKHYYLSALLISEQRDLIMQYFDETMLRQPELETVTPINERFQIRKSHIEVAHTKVFEQTPSSMLELFILFAANKNIVGVRASTARLLRKHSYLIDDKFRADPGNQQLFMRILSAPHRINAQLRLMKRFGVLGAYLPEFDRIIGQMQHDLFHIYTVDAHTLQLITNLRSFFYKENQEHFPIASRIMRRIEKPALLYIAGLYHDIAKGRGGDHSLLGVVDAREFCERHDISNRDTNLICWLVEHHLSMSSVAQRQDLSDPDVIHAFATLVSDERRLDHLYALTVADINATNPTLWNSWRASLMRQLYGETRSALRRGLDQALDKEEAIEEGMDKALSELVAMGFEEEEVFGLWNGTNEEYFMRESVTDIVWHTSALLEHSERTQPLVLIKESSSRDFEGATQIFVYTKSEEWLFAVLAATLEQLHLSIQDARIYQSDRGFTLDSFYVLNQDNFPLNNDPERYAQITNKLMQNIANSDQFDTIIRRRTPRQLRMFNMPTRTRMTTDIHGTHTSLEVTTPDRPGLLAKLGAIFYDLGINLSNAKIATLGERVEDVFFLTDRDNKPLTDPELCNRLQKLICQELDQREDEPAAFSI